MLTIVLCDDIELHLKQAEKRVTEILDRQDLQYELHLFHNAESLLDQIEFRTIRPDIAILDIEMSGEDGISLAKKLNAFDRKCSVIFLTGYLKYAPDAYETEHIWLVFKNRAEEHLEPALLKALDVYKNNQTVSPGIVVRDNRNSKVIPVEEILYITKVGRKAQVKCLDAEYYDTRSPAALIPKEMSEYFLQCHQSYWVNFKMIAELDKEELVLKQGIRIPISRSHREEVRKKFFERYHYQRKGN